jgi:hypothetical protein
MIVLRSIALFGVGLAACLAALAPLQRQWSWTQEPAYPRSDLMRYEAFSPDLPVRARHVTIGSCETAIPIVANDLDSPGIPTRAMAPAWLGSMLNFVLHGGYRGGDDVGFYDLSVPNTLFAEHTNLLWHALRIPDLETVLYVNGVSLYHLANPETTLELVATLEALERDYPAASASVRAYLSLHLQRPEYMEGISRWGADWRRFIDPATMTFRGPGAATVDLDMKPKAEADWRAQLQYRLANAKKIGLALTEGPSLLLRRVFTALGVDERRRATETIRELNWAAQHRDRPGLKIHVAELSSLLFLDDDQAEFHRRWLVMAADLVETRGARLIVYAQPMINLTPDQYQQNFKTHYVNRAAQWLADSRTMHIDHTIAHDLAATDFTLYCQDSAKCSPDVQSNGYWANMIGRYKQARLLIEELRRLGVLDVQPSGGEPWRGIRRLNDPPRCIHHGDRTECLAW